MAVIRSHLRADPWRPRLAWREDDVIQWGRPLSDALDEDGQPLCPHFFEVFPREGSCIRGEGRTLEEAENHCHGKALAHRACDHAWSRRYDSGLGLCRRCGATQRVFQPIVEIGAWKTPLNGYELDQLFSGSMEPVTSASLSGPRWDRSRRRLWLRCRLNGIDVPRPPSEPKDLLEITPYQRRCASIALNLLREGGGDDAIERGTIIIDGRVVSHVRPALSQTVWAWKNWKKAGFPDPETTGDERILEP
ncbi:hypothetical protein LAZ40_04510 [Cereibacter sphaeroides]|uniref:hypothetical protein n=1 Tax=Cereibacter sphaeroides TaxID=1063 RepID=UPI001F270AFA|nr:hypothetical protein [Cereibacter sphaeroides]MCE6958318.1 hypothetical protein [Cereibacter sphaeroides]MCE6971928.1 hypothetical protein [Cereibacter sphaeroides]